jgi:hypothetical protein
MSPHGLSSFSGYPKQHSRTGTERTRGHLCAGDVRRPGSAIA